MFDPNKQDNYNWATYEKHMTKVLDEESKGVRSQPSKTLVETRVKLGKFLK